MSRLIAFWKQAAKDLDFEVISPFILKNLDIEAKILIKGYGAQKGMLIVSNYEEIEKKIDSIVEEGYGFSVLDEPMTNEEYNVNDFKDVLEDWGKTNGHYEY